MDELDRQKKKNYLGNIYFSFYSYTVYWNQFESHNSN